ncbi:MAG: capsule biosynthesis protein [Longimicrobiales bacterium]
MFELLGLAVHRYSALLAPEELERAASLASSAPIADIRDWREDGVAVGEHAMAGSLRFFARADLGGEPTADAVLRRYFQAALLTTAAVTRLVRKHRFEVAVFHHGIYVPQGLVGEVCRREGVRVVNWNPAYRKQRFIFSHHQTYHHALMHEPTALWESMPWDEARDAELMAYLKSRWYGTEDWIWFHDRPRTEKDDIQRETGVDFSRPCVGLLTNVMWDAQLHYPANAFPSMLSWVLHTIDWFGRRPDLQLLIRVHPAEIRGTLPSAQPLVAEIARAYGSLPSNVFVIGPESHLSTYAVMERCDSVIIYGTKTGVELTAMGIPVIVAGEAWIRNKGLTLDASTIAEYDTLLGRLPLGGRLDDATVLRAKRYAYHFFFRRMIPVLAMQPAKGNPPYRANVQGMHDLEPGSCPGLDVICRGILEGSEFIYPAEQMPVRA